MLSHVEAVSYKISTIPINNVTWDIDININDKGDIVWLGGDINHSGLWQNTDVYRYDNDKIDKLSTNKYPKHLLTINNIGNIVWSEYVDGAWYYQIVTYYNGVTDIISNVGRLDDAGSIGLNNRGKLVWSIAYDSYNPNGIYLYDKTLSQNPLLISNIGMEGGVVINDKGQFVWTGYLYPEYLDIFLYDNTINSNPINLTNAQGFSEGHFGYPCYTNAWINNSGQIIYHQIKGCSGLDLYDICLYDKDNILTPINITNNPEVEKQNPIISNSGIIIFSSGNDIYYYNSNDIKYYNNNGIQRITNDNYWSIIHPYHINDYGVIVWRKGNYNESGYLATNEDIFLYDCLNGKDPINITNYNNSSLILSTPKINNVGTIAWVSRDRNTHNYFLNIATPQVEVANKIYGVLIGAEHKNPYSPGVIFRGDLGAEILSNKLRNIPDYDRSYLLTTKMADGGTKKSDVKAAIKYLKEHVLKSGDGLIIYVNCHGAELKSASSAATYVLCIGSERDINIDTINEYQNDYITDSDLNEILNGMDDIQKWVFIDSCHSGGFYNSIHSLKKASLIASTTSDLLAWGYDFGFGEVKGGLFTSGLGDGLSRKENGKLWMDVDPEDGFVTFREILNYLQEYNQKIDLAGSIVYELGFGDPTIFTLDKWTPTGFRTADFVGALNGKKKVNMPPIINLLLH